MAYKFIPYAPDGSGGKDPVLGELVVTENGVYDEPVIAGGLEPIIWDGVSGEVWEAMSGPVASYVKVSDVGLNVHDLICSTVVFCDEMSQVGTQSLVLGEDNVLSFAEYAETEMGGSTHSQGAVVVMEGTSTDSSGATSTFRMGIVLSISEVAPEDAEWLKVGTYFLRFERTEPAYVQSLTFPATSSTPADGWNKVTVNVAGDIIDVDELPAVNIEEGKIYRVTKESEESATIYGVNVQSPAGIMSGDFLSMMEEGYKSYGFAVTIGLYIVDSLPEELRAPVTDSAVKIMERHYYVIRETGEFYETHSDGDTVYATSVADSGVPFHGIISDPSEATEDGFYTIMTPAESSTTYGIPDEADNKTVFEHNGSEWVECGAGSGGTGGDSIVVDVPELPTENVDDRKIYRTTEESETIIWLAGKIGETEINMPLADYFTPQLGRPATVITYVVDSLPDTMEVLDEATFTMPCYILKDTGVAYLSFDGSSSTAMTIGNMMGGADGGWVDSTDDISASDTITFYTIRGGSFTVYGVPNQQETKYVCEYKSDGVWVNTTKEAAKVIGLESEVDNLTTEVDNLTTEVDSLTTENAELESENNSLRMQVNSNTGAANFVKYSVMEATEEGVTLKNIDNTSIDSIAFPDSIVTLQSNSLTSCGVSLKNIVWGKGIKHLCANVFGSSVLSATTVLQNIYVADLESWLSMQIDGSFTEYAHPLGSLTNGSGSYVHFYVGDELVTNLIIPDGITNIINHSFSNCRDIRSVTFPTSVTTIGRKAFQYTTLSGELVIPESIESIGDNAFVNHSYNLSGSDDGIVSVTFGSGLQTIGNSAFKGNAKLRTVTFKSKPTIATTYEVFNECKSLADIYVPWAEGEVAGAPWGATNATVHYNYTPDESTT